MTVRGGPAPIRSSGRRADSARCQHATRSSKASRRKRSRRRFGLTHAFRPTQILDPLEGREAAEVPTFGLGQPRLCKAELRDHVVYRWNIRPNVVRTRSELFEDLALPLFKLRLELP